MKSMKPEITLVVSKYTDMPIGRNELDGPKNGKDYREKYLLPALKEYQVVKVDFNGTLGTTPSFLEELFGGVVRERHLTAAELISRVPVIYKFESVKNNVVKYITEAEAFISKGGA
ncbi:STAS-like domain-containing protein [Pseudomonas sp. SDO558_S425]